MTQTPDAPIRVLIAANLSDALVEQVRAVSPRLKVERYAGNVPDKAWAEAEVLFTGSVFPDPALAPRLRWIQLTSAGADHVAHAPIARAADIEITTASGIHAQQSSEYCLLMMLAFAYKLPRLLELQAKQDWYTDAGRTLLPGERLFAPVGLRGQTLGIVGYGSIGRELARLADALGMRVLAVKRDVMRPEEGDQYREFPPPYGDPNGEIPRRLYPPEALASMAAECDYLALTTPLTPATRHLVDERVLKSMKKTAVLINIARGAVVDEAALISALAANVIAGAALDVFETEPLPPTSPLWNLPNVIITPHIAGNSATYAERAVALFIENMRRYLDKRPLYNRVQREAGY
jgi:phosphoglycerate dehydrogenase-like enzyme